ncbi:MAG: hypothetical protein JOZ02_07460 [Acidobacteria bacterium]|nr:hypothetical protein [Acidobacteriota bacterium]
MKQISGRKAKLAAAYSALSLVSSGIIDPEGKTEEELRDEVIEYLQKYSFQIVIDYTGDILRQARTFHKLKNEQFACLFYALWVEHQLNNIVASLAQTQRLSYKEIDSMVRDTSYRAKVSWLLRILGVKPLSAAHSNRIFKLMELRNSFVHYKWKPESEQQQKELTDIINAIEKTVRYLRDIENRFVYKRRKRLIKKVV